MAKCVNSCNNKGIKEFDGECASCHEYNQYGPVREKTVWGFKKKGSSAFSFFNTNNGDDDDKKDNGGGGLFGW